METKHVAAPYQNRLGKSSASNTPSWKLDRALASQTALHSSFFISFSSLFRSCFHSFSFLFVLLKECRTGSPPRSPHILGLTRAPARVPRLPTLQAPSPAPESRLQLPEATALATYLAIRKEFNQLFLVRPMSNGTAEGLSLGAFGRQTFTSLRKEAFERERPAAGASSGGSCKSSMSSNGACAGASRGVGGHTAIVRSTTAGLRI